MSSGTGTTEQRQPIVYDLGEGIRLEITELRDNPLIGRKELYGYLHHYAKGTPQRYEIRKKIAEIFKVPVEVVYVRNIKTEFGWGRSRIEVHIYRDPKRAEQIEPLHIRIRNLPPEERKKALEELKRKRKGG